MPGNGQELVNSRIDLGVIEERYAPSSVFRDDKAYRLGVRPIFYWDGQDWKSYSEMFDTPDYNGKRVCRAEFGAHRKWYMSENKEAIVESRANSLLPDSLWLAVQDISKGSEHIPEGKRGRAFNADAIGKPVRPPVIVSTVAGFEVDDKLSDAVTLNAPDIPEAVVAAGYKQLVWQRNSNYHDQEPSELALEETLAIKKLLRVAVKYRLRREKVNLYAFENKDESVLDWTSAEPPWICQKQGDRYDVWPLRESLRFIGGGDFNLDGSWEYLFWIDGYNENGYLLVSFGLRKIATYSWHYH